MDGDGDARGPDVRSAPGDVVAALADSGLVVEKAERVQRSVTTEDGLKVAINALVRARRPQEP